MEAALNSAGGSAGAVAQAPRTKCQQCLYKVAIAMQSFLTFVISVIPGVNDASVDTGERFGFSNGFEEGSADELVARPGHIPERVMKRLVAGRFLLGIYMIDTLSWGVGKTVQCVVFCGMCPVRLGRWPRAVSPSFAIAHLQPHPSASNGVLSPRVHPAFCSPPDLPTHTRFEVTWLAEDYQAETVDYVRLALIMQVIEVVVEFLASAMMPLIFRAVQCSAHMTSKQLAQFALKAYTASNILAVFIYPPIMIVTYWIGAASLKTNIASIVIIAVAHAIQYAFINQVGDASVEMAKPHWLRTFDGATMVFPGFPLLCCCDRQAVACRRKAHEERRRDALGADFDDSTLLPDPSEEDVPSSGCCCRETSDVETIHARYSLNVVARATPATLSVYITMLRFMLFAILGALYTMMKRAVALRFIFIMTLSIGNAAISLLMWLNMDVMVEGIIDEACGGEKQENGGGRSRRQGRMAWRRRTRRRRR